MVNGVFKSDKTRVAFQHVAQIERDGDGLSVYTPGEESGFVVRAEDAERFLAEYDAWCEQEDRSSELLAAPIEMSGQ